LGEAVNTWARLMVVPPVRVTGVRAVLGAGDHGQPAVHGAALRDVIGDRVAQLGIFVHVDSREDS
jgi:hypothetical protein